MDIEIVDLHSVCTGLLTQGPVLDAGCRGFRFMEWFVKRGHPVVAMDPDSSVHPPDWAYETERWNHFYRCALVGPGHPNVAHLRMTEDAEARHLTFAPKEADPMVECKSLELVMLENQVTMWDVLKLNVEGAEYDILNGLKGPVARQIVVSFHEHTDRRRGDAVIAGIVEHLAQWYVPIRHEFDERYCAGRNAWDSVFALKELV